METIVIRPRSVWSIQEIKEIWRYRELLYFFTWRDFKVRYKQTVLGILWAIFQPLLTMVVFSIFFGRIAKIPSDNLPYPLFAYSGLLLWQFFSSSLSETSQSLIGNQAIISKAYFPRLLLPVSAVVNKFVDFFFSGLVFVGLMAYYQIFPQLYALPIFFLLLLLTFLLSTGLGLFLAALNVTYRDIRYVLPFFIQLLLFVTPVIYPASIAGPYQWLLDLNPLSSIITSSHILIASSGPVDWAGLGRSFVVSGVLFFLGYFYFRRVERRFADII